MEYSSRNYFFSSYVKHSSKAERRARIAKHAQKLVRKGQILCPITIKGRTIARTFLGKAWCDHLTTCRDYGNRLPLGLVYVRNGSVFDLEISQGQISAQVMGDSLYNVFIKVKPMQKIKRHALVKTCLGKIGSLIELSQGRCSKIVKKMIIEGGIFPKPEEISVKCTCPENTSVCKHVAAVLHGFGACLDVKPEWLFELRQIRYEDLMTEPLSSINQ